MLIYNKLYVSAERVREGENRHKSTWKSFTSRLEISQRLRRVLNARVNMIYGREDSI